MGFGFIVGGRLARPFAPRRRRRPRSRPQPIPSKPISPGAWAFFPPAGPTDDVSRWVGAGAAEIDRMDRPIVENKSRAGLRA